MSQFVRNHNGQWFIVSYDSANKQFPFSLQRTYLYKKQYTYVTQTFLT